MTFLYPLGCIYLSEHQAKVHLRGHSGPSAMLNAAPVSSTSGLVRPVTPYLLLLYW